MAPFLISTSSNDYFLRSLPILGAIIGDGAVIGGLTIDHIPFIGEDLRHVAFGDGGVRITRLCDAVKVDVGNTLCPRHRGREHQEKRGDHHAFQ